MFMYSAGGQWKKTLEYSSAPPTVTVVKAWRRKVVNQVAVAAKAGS